MPDAHIVYSIIIGQRFISAGFQRKLGQSDQVTVIERPFSFFPYIMPSDINVDVSSGLAGQWRHKEVVVSFEVKGIVVVTIPVAVITANGLVE